MLVLDASGVSRLATRSPRLASLLRRTELRYRPPIVPSVVLVECLTGSARDVPTNRFLLTCDIRSGVSVRLARRSAELRARAGRGSAVDAIVVATAEPGGTVLTGDNDNLRALAEHAVDVEVVGC